MFSHVLISYMSELRQFAEKTNNIFEAISKALEQKPKYDFCVLKDLTQNEGIPENSNDNKTTSFDKDQSLFFAVSLILRIALVYYDKQILIYYRKILSIIMIQVQMKIIQKILLLLTVT